MALTTSQIIFGFGFILLATILQSAHSAEMPDYIQVCSRSDPQLAECVKNTVHKIRPHLKNGIQELNVPAMEPLYIGDLNILDGGTGGLNAKAKKLNIYGASNFEIKKIKASNDAKRFDFELLLPRLEGHGNYVLNGQILTLPLKGNGPFTGNFTNFYAYVKVLFDVKKINDIDYVTLNELEVKIRTGQGAVRLENLFNGDKTLGDVINETINKNFEVFVNELIGPIERALSKKFGTIASKVVENFTYDELFPQ